MKHLIVLLFLFISFTLFAGDRTLAYNTVCKPMTFESDKEDCIAKIRMFSWFDETAITICRDLRFNSSKIDCLKLIGNKVYEAWESDRCVNQRFESEKLSCLLESGTQYDPGKSCVSNETAIRELRQGLRELRAGQTTEADKRMSWLLDKYVSCSQR